MSKLMTDSKTLSDKQQVGLDENDNLLSEHIRALKNDFADMLQPEKKGGER